MALATASRLTTGPNFYDSLLLHRISPEQLHAMYEPKMEKKDDD